MGSPPPVAMIFPMNSIQNRYRCASGMSVTSKTVLLYALIGRVNQKEPWHAEQFLL